MYADILLLALATSTFLLYRWITASRLKLPPGPPADPFIGNLRQMASFDSQQETFAEWGKVFGDVMHARIFGRSMIILNSFRAARDLMDKRSLNYSCRPRLVLIAEMMGWDSVLTNLPYGERFRKHRRLIQEAFSPQAILAFRPLQRMEACTLLLGLLESPDSFMGHVRRFSAATIMKIAYGHTVNSVDELYVRLAEEAATDTVNSGSPGSMLVDFLTSYVLCDSVKYLPSWMPGAGFKRHASKTRVKVHRMIDAPFQMVKRTMAAGTAIPSFTSSLLVDKESGNPTDLKEEEDIKAAAGVLYGAATDTTSACLDTFFLAMTLYPEVQAKAQEELDRVIGPDRLPDFNDREAHSLPYLECVIKEVYRWGAPVPLGLPHRSMKDDRYRGYDIPGDTIIVPNIWSDMYPEPNVFWPDRFAHQDNATAEVTDPKNTVFGFGRRVCPGQWFGDANIWLITACVLATFRISRARDERGEDIIPAGLFSTNFVRHPKPFKCGIKPRSQKAVELIHEIISSLAG
ncbi:cytochrome P450 monooxygenase 105 [Heterobasidion irregulare TC 32-1]|uniref:Cytochrome P450 monooxygenase 105 n=1 Tax=Heterobasidion irregulare (strain TC 32-1) TaxID=747525 RepID=W4K3V4_HETIT|nr:cytochrome P450 monooxygenase 105 [Heterobasidion irregulare TC 32-1]ETW79741.1 cytochrome P450 monooxygenase 105 [Heterobasidion irregulare TC 32-1]